LKQGATLAEQSREIIMQGSKSFSLAALLLGRETRDSAFLLYHWCRYCDDMIDQAEPGKAHEKLQMLREQTIQALTGAENLEPAFLALSRVVKKYSIPHHYPLELLAGMEMDVLQCQYNSFANLKLYCYRVAGVVGLMMAHILGVSHEKALRNACDMGIAMQLTNIARDILTDAQINRIYLPVEWLKEVGIPPLANAIMSPKHRAPLFLIVKKLLNEAEVFYQSGDRGLPFLATQPRLAIMSARYIYSDIGQLILYRKSFAWDTRTFVPLYRKIFWISLSLVRLTWQGLFKPRFQATPITQVWRFQ